MAACAKAQIICSLSYSASPTLFLYLQPNNNWDQPLDKAIAIHAIVSEISSSGATASNRKKAHELFSEYMIMTNRILLVDDEPDLTSVFGMTLEDSGFEVDKFNDPFLALSNFRADLYHLLLIDVRMPRMDGFALYEKLKNIDDKVKVCFITAYEVDTQELTQRFPRLDINSSIIKKPICNEDFVRRVNKIINS